jgi:5'-3' exoribonuclease 2
MGVPAFYRWLSQKYPKIVGEMAEEYGRVVSGTALPMDLTQPNPNGIEFDNLYIDMNGLIHPCAHPEDAPPPETEEHMYIAINKYVDRLVAAVRPRKVLYLAIDGCAPRAKMNQQRSRRFRTAQEAEQMAETKREARQEMAAMGHKVPPEGDKAWDSNVITPGTLFMEKLTKYLRFYIHQRMSNDPAWRGVKVILSDASVPGEGEHKIMEFIRAQRAQEGYDPQTKHVLHGLDADLIMLALATHEAHFFILREEVVFGRRPGKGGKGKGKGKGRIQGAGAYDHLEKVKSGLHGEFDTDSAARPAGWKPLQILKVAVLREYLLFEFKCLEGLPFGFDFERIIDDFVFMCMFVGNDFLPHLPSLDIRDGALEFLFDVYKRLLPSLGDYLTNTGIVNLDKVDVIMAEVGQVENEVFRRRAAKDANDKQRREWRNKRNKQGGHGQIAADAARNDAIAIQPMAGGPHTRPGGYAANSGWAAQKQEEAQALSKSKNANSSAAQALKEKLTGGKRKADELEAEAEWKDGDDDAAGGAAEPEPVVEMVFDTSEETKAQFKHRMKQKADAEMDRNRASVVDIVRLGEDGWKNRYYTDKYKSDDITHGGGREEVYRQYTLGLCWCLHYYYKGVASW